jgi:hypothetical protein
VEVLHLDIICVLCSYMKTNRDVLMFLSVTKDNHALKHKVCFDVETVYYERIRDLAYIKSIKNIDFTAYVPDHISKILSDIVPKKIVLGYHFLYFSTLAVDFIPTTVTVLDVRNCRFLYLQPGAIPFHVKKLYLGSISHGLSKGVIHSNITHLKLTKPLLLHEDAIPSTLKMMDKYTYRKK